MIIERNTAPRLFLLALTTCSLAILLSDGTADAAGAVELPMRKAGLWEMKVLNSGSPMPSMTMQHCTDAATDKQMATSLSPMTKEACQKNDIAQTATGYTVDAACTFGGLSTTSHSDITGDFNSAYKVTSVSRSKGGPAGLPAESTTAIEAKWLGPCKPEQKPGDIVMPGGFKMNISDMDKLKALLPK